MERPQDPNSSKLLQADLTEKVIGIFYNVYNDLGYGFLESVYENGLSLALSEAGLNVVREQVAESEPVVVRE